MGRTVPSSVPVPTTGPAAPSMAPVSASLGGSARTAHRVSCDPATVPLSVMVPSTHRAELSWRQEHLPKAHLFICIISMCMACVQVPQHVCGGERPTLQHPFSSSTFIWVPGIKLRLTRFG